MGLDTSRDQPLYDFEGSDTPADYNCRTSSTCRLDDATGIIKAIEFNHTLQVRTLNFHERGPRSCSDQQPVVGEFTPGLVFNLMFTRMDGTHPAV